MPSLKSLFILGVVALSAFALPGPSAGEVGLVARSDAMVPVAAPGIAPIMENVVPMKREPEALIPGSTLPEIIGTCQSGLNNIKAHLIDITVGGTVKVDTNILVGIVLQIKALIDVAVADIQAIASLSLSVILTVSVSVFVNLCVTLIVTIVACLKLCINACVAADLQLVLDACAQVDVSLTALLNVCASLIVGLHLHLLLAIKLVVGLVVDLRAVALVKVCVFLGI